MGIVPAPLQSCWLDIDKVKERKLVGEGLYVALPVVGGQ